MDFDEFYPDLRTTALAACEKDEPEHLRRLIAAGKSMVAADSKGRQPVHVAAEKSAQCLKLLLDRGE